LSGKPAIKSIISASLCPLSTKDYHTRRCLQVFLIILLSAIHKSPFRENNSYPRTLYRVLQKIPAISLPILLVKKGLFLLGVAIFLVVVSILSAFTYRPVIKEEVIVYLQRPLEEKLASTYFYQCNPAGLLICCFFGSIQCK
jgi:hypothetical protein